MELFKKIVIQEITILLFVAVPFLCSGQKNDSIKSIIAKVTNFDKDVYDEEFFIKTGNWPRKFYYAIHHLSVVSAKGDTLQIGYVFDVKRQINEALSNFAIKKDSVYKFQLYKIEACNCDFPLIVGCEYKKMKSNSIYIPPKRSIITNSYKEIYRILDYIKIDIELWNELKKSDE